MSDCRGIELKGVSFIYSGGDKALNNVSLTFPAGKKIALMGSNGAGKSTLMLLLNGILKPTEGQLLFKNKPYSYRKKYLKELRQRIGVVFQNTDDQIIAPSVYEEITLGISQQYNDEKQIREKAEYVIEHFKLQELKERSPHKLSAGQKKRVCMAAITAMEPEFLICDEPTSSLDPENAKQTLKYLDKYQKRGNSVIMSTHDVNQAYQWADYVIVIHKGNILISGDVKTVFSSKETIREAGLDQPFLVETAQHLFPEIEKEKLPLRIDELKKLLITEKCTDLL